MVTRPERAPAEGHSHRTSAGECVRALGTRSGESAPACTHQVSQGQAAGGAGGWCSQNGPGGKQGLCRPWAGRVGEAGKLTTPLELLIPFMLIFVTNRTKGGASGYLGPHSILRLYIRFS